MQHLHGWLSGSTTPSFLCQKGTKVHYEVPSASYTMDGTVLNLVPLDGKPTWVQSPDSPEGTGGPESNKEASSKYSKSIDATQLAQAPVATSPPPSRRECTPWQIVRSTVKAPLLYGVHALLEEGQSAKTSIFISTIASTVSSFCRLVSSSS